MFSNISVEDRLSVTFFKYITFNMRAFCFFTIGETEMESFMENKWWRQVKLDVNRSQRRFARGIIFVLLCSYRIFFD